MLRKLLSFIQNLFLRRQKGIFYINGPDVLPPPLSREEEAELLASPLTPESKNRLIEHNLRLVVYIAKRFENTGIGIEDLVSIGTIGLVKAIGSFCPEKNIKLATYASRCIENEILMYIRKNANGRGEISIDEPLNVDWDGNELLLSDVLGSEADEIGRGVEQEAENKLLISLVNELTPREKRIMELRFGLNGCNEHTQSQVAELLGISQSYISRLEKRIIGNLKENFLTRMV